jgi:site-specific DNA recombinase
MVTNTKTKSKTKRAALYARISADDHRNGAGVERQRGDMRKLAKREGWTISEYVDNDKSASRYAKKRREQFSRMLADVDAGLIDVIVCADLSRYTREPRLVEDLIDLTDSGHVELVTLSGGAYDVTTPEGKMRLRNESTFAASYSDFISHKTKRAKLAMIEAGDSPGGTRAFGYKGAALGRRAGTVLEPSEAKAYLHAVEDVLRGATLVSICERWNAAGLRTPRTGSPWGVPSMRATLTNPHHAGLLAVSHFDEKGRRSRRREIVGKGNWPAIITRAQHEKLVAMIDDPDRRRRNPPRRSLLTGVVFCECGEAMRRDPRYYRCRRLPDRPDACGAVIIPGPALDEAMIATVLARLDSPKLAKALRAPKRKVDPGTEDPAVVLAELDDLAAAVGRGDLPIREHLIIRKAIEARLERARAAHAEDGENASVLAPFATGAIDELWSDLDLDRRRAVLRVLIDTVTIRPAKSRGGVVDLDRVDVRWRA